MLMDQRHILYFISVWRFQYNKDVRHTTIISLDKSSNLSDPLAVIMLELTVAITMYLSILQCNILPEQVFVCVLDLIFKMIKIRLSCLCNQIIPLFILLVAK